MKMMVILNILIIKYACPPPTPFLRETTLLWAYWGVAVFWTKVPLFPSTLTPLQLGQGLIQTAKLPFYQQPVAWFRKFNSTRFNHYVYCLVKFKPSQLLVV